MVVALEGVKKSALYVVLPDKKAWDWLVMRAGKSIRIKCNFRPLTKKATYILLCCDFKCRSENCLRKFLFALRNESTPFGIIRPTFLSDRRPDIPKYLFEAFSRATDFLIDGDGNNPTEIIFARDQSSYALKHDILRIQKWIIDHHGKIDSVTRLKSELRITNRQSLSFITETNLHLKTFIDKIRMCNSLWKIISSEESVKSVAYEFGFNPKSFSRKFYGTFGIWPSGAQMEKVNPLATNNVTILNHQKE